MRTRRSEPTNPTADMDGDAPISSERPSTTITLDCGTSQAQPPNNSDPTVVQQNDLSEATRSMGASIQELIKTMQKLERLGMGKLTCPLPTIVAIGDQSAGKSSTIENISETKLPKSTGTCTRCPFQITLQSSNVSIKFWKISLSRTHYYSPHNPQPCLNGKLSEFYPWLENQQDKPDVIEFATIDNLEKLEDALRRAQLATLNPQTDPREYLDMATLKPDSFEVEFSPNKICIEVFAPNLPSLTFIDLPGVISQTADGKQSNLPKLVKNLVKKHIAPMDVIILLACSMEGDISNSNASQIVRKMGAESRCIGVLTKPDRIPGRDKETIETWRGVLSGAKFPLGHQYFVTKQPSPKQTTSFGHNYTAIRDAERKFFSENKPWCFGGQLHEFSERFGTENLQMVLSLKLGELIRQSLPDIYDRVQKRLFRIEDELVTIPEIPPTRATHTVWECLRELTFRIKNDILRVPELRGVQKRFKEALTDTAPQFKRSAEKDSNMAAQVYVSSAKVFVSLLDTDDEMYGDVDESPSKKRKKNDSFRQETNGSFNSMPPLAEPKASGLIFSLDSIAGQLDQYTASGIPNEVDPKSVDELILQTLKHWNVPVFDFLASIDRVLSESIIFAIQEVLRPHENTALYQETMTACKEFVQNLIGEQKDAITRELHLERHKPLVSNEEGWRSQCEAVSARYRQARFDTRKKAYLKFFQEKTGTDKGPNKEEMIKADETCRQEPYARELEVMAKIRGYYNIASMRFIDNVNKSIQADIFAQLQSRDLHEHLAKTLQVSGENGEGPGYPDFYSLLFILKLL